MLTEKLVNEDPIQIFEEVETNKCHYCGKIFISKSALNYHYKNIHNMKTSQISKENNKVEIRFKREIGRPKVKFEFNRGKNDAFFSNFFSSDIRKPLPEEDCSNKQIQESIVNDVFSIVYKSDSIIGHQKTYIYPKDVSILNYILTDYIVTSLQNLRTIDEILYEFYLSLWHQSNKIYLTNILLFLMYLNEYLKNKQNAKLTGFSIGQNAIDNVPEEIQPFFNNFMRDNNYFEIMKQNIEEWFEIAKYFVIWLTKNGYISYELSNNYDE